MNTKMMVGGALSGLVIAGGVATFVSAQSAAEATGLTEEQIIEIALTEVPGEVTEVELENRRGKTYYEVDVTATDGTAMELKIGAETGDVLRVREEGEHCDKDRKKSDA